MNVFKKEEMISVAEFAKKTKISRRYAYNLVELTENNGGIRAFRFGRKRCLRVPLSEVERFKNFCQVKDV